MTVRFDLLNIKDPRVQEFLWRWVEPSQFGFGLTKLEAMKEVEARLLSRRESLYGDMERGIALRVAFPRPDVAMPHVLGNATWIRSMTLVSASVLFGMGMKWIHIWTQDPRIADIVEAFGYKRQAVLFGHGYIVDGEEEMTAILSMERSAFYRESSLKEVASNG